MQERAKYKTRQRELVARLLEENAGRYLTVDDVHAAAAIAGERVGRTTVYRALEAMAQDGRALKAHVPGGEASYRFAEDGAAGQLVCLECGSVFPLDCSSAASFAEHVLDGHGFRVDPARTVLYGRCRDCMEERDER